MFLEEFGNRAPQSEDIKCCRVLPKFQQALRGLVPPGATLMCLGILYFRRPSKVDQLQQVGVPFEHQVLRLEVSMDIPQRVYMM